ncbi:hypothetical protein HG531_003612 [Fusarium graminearum]|nr:hypothetical protein HG531_003612 [Fusarium graminearum]
MRVGGCLAWGLDVVLTESQDELQKVILITLDGSGLGEFGGLEDMLNLGSDQVLERCLADRNATHALLGVGCLFGGVHAVAEQVEILLTDLVGIHGRPCDPVALANLMRVEETSSQRLVLSREANAQYTVQLLQTNSGDRIASAGAQSQSEFSLNHENADAWGLGHGDELGDDDRRNLVGRVADADINGGKSLHNIEFSKIAHDDLELLLQRPALDSFRQFSSHSGIELDSLDSLGLLQDSRGEDTSSGTDFEDGVGGLEVCLCDDGVCDTRVLQDMLADVGVELEDPVCGGLLTRDGTVAAHRMTLQDEVCTAATNEEAFGTVGHDTSKLSSVAARQLDTHNVGVLGDAEDRIRGEIPSGCSTGEVVHENRDGALVSNGVEMLNDQIIGEKTAVVAWRQMGTFAVGAVNNDASYACLEQLDNVLFKSWTIYFILGGEEGKGRDVDAIA